MEKVGGAIGLLLFFFNDLDEVLQAGDPKQQIGWATPPGAP